MKNKQHKLNEILLKIEKRNAERLGVSVEEYKKMTVSEVRKKTEKIHGKKMEFIEYPSSIFW